MSWSTFFQSRPTLTLIALDYLADHDYLTVAQFKGGVLHEIEIAGGIIVASQVLPAIARLLPELLLIAAA